MELPPTDFESAEVAWSHSLPGHKLSENGQRCKDGCSRASPLHSIWPYSRLYVQVLRGRLSPGLYAEFVVHRDSQTLPATNIAFSGLNRDMPEEKLDLLKFASGIMAEPGA